MNMCWNHRIMKRRDRGEDFYAIYEVYYDESGKIDGWTEDSCSPEGDSLEELKESFRFFRQAFHAPILDYETGKKIDG